MGINIKVFDFGFNLHENFSLSIYVDSYKTNSNVNQLLAQNANPAMYGDYFHSYYSIVNNQLDVLLNKIIDNFFYIFSYKEKMFNSIDIYVYIFQRYVVRYSCTNAIEEIEKILVNKYPESLLHAIPIIDTKLVIVCSDLNTYNKIKSHDNFEHIKHLCYSITKKYDKFDCLKEKDYVVEVYNKYQDNPEELGIDPRDWYN